MGQNFLASYRGDLIGTYNSRSFAPTEKKGVIFEKLDIRSYDQVNDLFKNHAIDKVVLAASIIHSRNKKLFHDVNVDGAGNVIKAMKAWGVKPLIYLSTAVLNNKEEVWGEYGRTKDAAEKLIRESDLDYVILRPAEIYGPFEREGLGKLIALLGQHKIVPLINGGKNYFTPIHVSDVCEVINKCLANKIYDKSIYLLAGGQKIRMREFVFAVADNYRKRIIILDVPLSILVALSYLFPTVIDCDQIIRASNTQALVPVEAEIRFDIKFRNIDFSYLDRGN